MNAIALFNMVIRRHLPVINVRNEIAKTIDRSNFNIDHAIALINPTPPIASDNVAEGIGSCFISGLLSFPRFILPSGKIVIGGIDYLNFWMDGTPLPTHQKFTTPEELIADERRQRGGFDETVCKFRDVVKWIGEVTHTNKAAQLAVMKIDALVQAFRTTNLDGISYIDDAANDAESALQIFCAELADAKAATVNENGKTTPPCGFTEEDRATLKQVAGDAKIAAGKRKAQRTNGFRQAHFIEEYNAENVSETQKQELKAAVQLDKKQYPDQSKPRPQGYWKNLLTHAPSYPSAEALRKAVMRKRGDKRGQYKREGKKRGPYFKRV